METAVRLVLLILSAAMLGLIGGLGSALTLSGLLSDQIRLGEIVEIDGWRSNWSIGTEAVDPYTKAWIARYGLFALRREEAVYFFTTLDAASQPLNDACVYALDLDEQPGSWWSVTVYDGEGYLPKNADGRLSFDATKATGLESRRVVLSAEMPDAGAEMDEDAAYWVSTRNAGAFDVTLRVYQPTPFAIENPAQAFVLPQVERLSCAGVTPS